MRAAIGSAIVPTGERLERWRELVADTHVGAREGRFFTDGMDDADWPGNPETLAWLRRCDESARRMQRLASRRPTVVTAEPVRTHLPAWLHRSLMDLEETPAVSEAAEWVARHTGPQPTRRGLLLSGPVGTGKTSIAAAIAVMCGEPHHAAFWTVRELLTRIKLDISDGGRTLAYAAAKPLLVLDDLGVERATEFNGDTLRELLETRHLHQLPVVVTTNLSAAQLRTHLGERVFSRLMESCDEIVVTGRDRRR